MLVQFKVVAKPECIPDINKFLAEIFPDTRAFDGCIDITAYLNDDGQTYVFIEHWESKAQYEKYLAWRGEIGTMSQFEQYLQGPPSIKYFEVVDA
ncbi:MAG: putative quinol monooxygenase [Pseudohongiellaceae bacterium]